MGLQSRERTAGYYNAVQRLDDGIGMLMDALNKHDHPGDLAYRVSREQRYNGTPVRQAFDTLADPPEYELYDLENDSAEFHNLAGKPDYREVQRRLTQMLIEYRNATDDPFRDSAFLERFSRRAASPTKK